MNASQQNLVREGDGAGRADFVSRLALNLVLYVLRREDMSEEIDCTLVTLLENAKSSGRRCAQTSSMGNWMIADSKTRVVISAVGAEHGRVECAAQEAGLAAKAAPICPTFKTVQRCANSDTEASICLLR